MVFVVSGSSMGQLGDDCHGLQSIERCLSRNNVAPSSPSFPPPPSLQAAADQGLPAALVTLAAAYERGEPGVVARDSVTAASLRARVLPSSTAGVAALAADLRETAEGYGGETSVEGRALLSESAVVQLEATARGRVG